MKRAIFLGGLPGSGKTTYMNSFYFQFEYEGLAVVSADEIRKGYPSYDGTNDEELHELSVRDAEEEVREYLGDGTSFVMDAGAINNNYTCNLILEAQSAGFATKVIFLDTPVGVCLERIANRERKVPTEAIYRKSQKVRSTLARLKKITTVEVVKYYTDKYMFFDLDGVLAQYNSLDSPQPIDFFVKGFFGTAEPVKHMIDRVNNLPSKDNVYIFSASPNSFASKEKKAWVRSYLPAIPEENIIFVGNKDYKHLSLEQLLRRLKISKKDATFVEDGHEVIRKCRALGINAIHISEF